MVQHGRYCSDHSVDFVREAQELEAMSPHRCGHIAVYDIRQKKFIKRLHIMTI
jgi:hypothetical protein